MQDKDMPYATILRSIEDLGRNRESVLMIAFEVFERRHPLLAEILLDRKICRLDAAIWMSRPHRTLNGKSGYQLLAQGDDELLWDELTDRKN